MKAFAYLLPTASALVAAATALAAAAHSSMQQGLAEIAAAPDAAMKTERAARQAVDTGPGAKEEAAATKAEATLAEERAAVASAPMGAETAGTRGTRGTCISGSSSPGCFDTNCSTLRSPRRARLSVHTAMAVRWVAGAAGEELEVQEMATGIVAAEVLVARRAVAAVGVAAQKAEAAEVEARAVGTSVVGSEVEEVAVVEAEAAAMVVGAKAEVEV